MNEFIKKIQTEYNFLEKDDKDKEIGKYLIEFAKIVEKDYPDFDAQFIRNIIYKMGERTRIQILSPLLLTEGEFIYTKPGLSVNTRNSYIQMDVNGIYYTNAYKLVIYNTYHSFTGEVLDLNKINDYVEFIDDKKIYLKSRGILLPYYFTKAYLYQKTIDKHKYIPAPAIKLQTNIITDCKKAFYVVDIYSDSFKTLDSCYDLHIKEDTENKNELEKLGVSYNIQYNIKK